MENKRINVTGDMERQFKALFGQSSMSFVNPFTGFDVIEFDDTVIKAPDGKSTRETLQANYGEDAVKLIERFMRL